MSTIDIQLQHRIEQFYYREAALLDKREYQQWLLMLAEDIHYVMPSRYSPQRDIEKRGQESFLALKDELESPSPATAPMREENIFTIALRADRAYKTNAWGFNPPARTRRIVGNVMIEVSENEKEYSVNSNFILYYSRHRNDNFIYSGQRNDTLRDYDGQLVVARREVILDWNVIEAPSVGLFF